MTSPGARPELTGVAGVVETVLSDALLARLPASAPPAPWDVACEAVVWCHRGGTNAAAALPRPLRPSRALLVLGAMVRYSATPVGAYDEVLGLVASSDGLRPWGSVAFMAVDSEASVVGGRTGWAMPKTLATFAGDLGPGRTLRAAGADRMDWRVGATPRAVGPRVPVAGRSVVRQVFPGERVGTSRLRARAWLRPALVTVDVGSDGPLPTWLRPGRHLGAVLDDVSLRLGAPTFSPE